MAETPLKTELILRGRVARRPVTLIGTLEGGRLTELSGSVTLNASLSSIVGDLGTDYVATAKVLEQLVGSGDIVLEKLGAAYSSGPESAQGGSVQVGLITKLGKNSCQFGLLKRLGKNGGFIVGVDLRSDEKVPNNFLSGLVGEISIGNLGVYYASEELKGVRFLGPEEFQDATQFALEPSRITPPRTFAKGVKLSAEILVGGLNLLDQLAIEKAESSAATRAGPQTTVDEAGE